MSLPKLPPQGEGFNKVNKSKPSLPNLPDSKDSQELSPELISKLGKSDFYDDNYEIIEELMLNEELTEEYVNIRKSYENIINIFQQSSTENEEEIKKKKEELNNHNFKSLDDFNNAVTENILDINKYNITELNGLIRELSQLESKIDSRDLKDYNFKTIDEFQSAVDKGLLNISKYDISEINDLLDGLDDKVDLAFEDYNITILGNVTINEIKVRLKQGQPTYETEYDTDKIEVDELYNDEDMILSNPVIDETHNPIKKIFRSIKNKITRKKAKDL